MPEKMLTLQELAEYLQVSEDKIIALVDEGVIVAYKLGGELLRFRREQIDAIRSEINSRARENEKAEISDARKQARERLKVLNESEKSDTVQNRISDFFYFNDFYILSGILIVILLVVIFKG
ncbi:helix-turn-helix domain-containing protein [Candidatus Omnitrophota bacterium]